MHAGHFFNRKPWLYLLSAALIAAGAASRPTTSSKPATTSKPATSSKPATAPATTRAFNVVQADQLLATFPRNASIIPARADARNMTIEGRVRDVRRATLPPAATGRARGGDVGSGQGTEVRVVIVGLSQADDAPAHVTLHMDAASSDDAMKLKLDKVIRVTGSLGPITAAADRIDLLNCHDLKEVGDLELGQAIVGKWSAPLRPDESAPQPRGRTGPETSVQLFLEITFTADGSFNEEVLDPAKSVKKLAGRWREIKGTGDAESKLHLEPRNATFVEQPARLEGGRLFFAPPGMADLRMQAQAVASKMVGTEFNYDGRAMKDQAMRWFQGNVGISNPQSMFQSVSNFIDQRQPNGMPIDWYAIALGPGMLRNSQRCVEVMVCNGKMFVLPYSDEQSRRGGLAARETRVSPIMNGASLMTPEVHVESMTLADGSIMTAGKNITGKITLRTLGKPLDAQYLVMLSSVGGVATAPIGKPGPDLETFDFSFNVSGTGGPDPAGVAFTVCRQAKRGDPSGDQKVRVISEPSAQLMDMGK